MNFYNKEEKKFYSFTESVTSEEFDEIDELFPKSKKYVRGTVYYNVFCFMDHDDGQSTRIIQMNQTDIKGRIPKFIVNKVVPNGMYDLVQWMEKALAK